MSSIVKVDTIQENTSANGITVDGLNIKDSKLVTANSVVNGNITNDAVTVDKLNLISTSSVPSLEAKGDGSSQDGYIQLNCSQNSHGIKLKSPAHSANASYTLTFPVNDGDANQVLTTNGSGVLSFATPASAANTPYFSVRENNDQNINNNSTTKLTWDNAVTESSSGVFDLSNNKFTATVAGRYLFSVRVGFYDSDNNLKRSTVYIYKNGSSVRTTDFFMADGGIRNSTVNDTWIENVSVNDYFEVYVLINTTDSGYVSVENGSNNETTFSGFKLT